MKIEKILAIKSSSTLLLVTAHKRNLGISEGWWFRFLRNFVVGWKISVTNPKLRLCAKRYAPNPVSGGLDYFSIIKFCIYFFWLLFILTKKRAGVLCSCVLISFFWEFRCSYSKGGFDLVLDVLLSWIIWSGDFSSICSSPFFGYGLFYVLLTKPVFINCFGILDWIH